MEGFSPRACVHARARTPHLAYGYNCEFDRSQVKVSDGAPKDRKQVINTAQTTGHSDADSNSADLSLNAIGFLCLLVF